MLSFKIIKNCFQDASLFKDEGADFFLEQDNWNDYHYHTTYHLHATPKLTKGKSKYLGVIKIMRIGQEENSNFVLKEELISQKKELTITTLPADYYSISFSVELYRGLSSLLSQPERKEFVESMHLILSEESPYYDNVKDEPVFLMSLLRDSCMESDALKIGRKFLLDKEESYKWEAQKLTVKFESSSQEVELDFSGVEDTDGITDIPSGIIAFIGHNGCGKSTSLYQIAKVLYASPSDRWNYEKVLSIAPNSVGINKLIFFSYSAFDNFVLPGLTFSDYKLIYNGLKDGTGRFDLCGVRDVCKEYSNYIKEYLDKEENKVENNKDTSDFKTIEDATEDRKSNISLKSIADLAREFSKSLSYIILGDDDDRQKLLKGLVTESEVLLPSLYEDIKWLNTVESEEEIVELFLSKSTGVKFFLHAMINLIQKIEDNSVVLFDEPENHLHPPFLSFMMKMFRKVIHEKHSVMLVATHSPIVLQETFSKNVFILRRNNGRLTFSKPLIETFGESFGMINTYVFNLNSDITNYLDVVEQMYKRWNCDDLNTFSSVLSRFKNKLGTKTVSSQVEGYLINKFFENHVEA